MHRTFRIQHSLILHSAPYILYSTLPLSVLCTLRSVLCTVHFIFRTASNLYSTPCIPYSVLPDSVLCTIHSVFHTASFFTLQHTFCIPHCLILYTALYIYFFIPSHSVHCSINSLFHIALYVMKIVADAKPFNPCPIFSAMQTLFCAALHGRHHMFFFFSRKVLNL